MASSPTTEPLSVRSLAKRYGELEVLRGIDLDVGAGSVVGLLGPNGTGKSTAMRCFAGVAPVTSGAIRVCGADPFEDHAVRGRIGYVPDVGGLFPRLSGREHLGLVAELYGGDVRRSASLATRLGLDDALDRRASSYSHGTSRKLSLALALGHDPALVLLDEPVDGVDPMGGRVIRELIREAADAGAAVVVSTHLLDVAARICDRVVVLAGGVVVADEPPGALADRAGDGDLETAYVHLLGGPA